MGFINDQNAAAYGYSVLAIVNMCAYTNAYTGVDTGLNTTVYTGVDTGIGSGTRVGLLYLRVDLTNG
jgi:hypothetical protein